MKAMKQAVLMTAILLAACGPQQDQKQEGPAAATPAEADAFIARVNEDLRRLAENGARAGWTASTYINEDTQYLSARATEEYLAYLQRAVEEAKRFEGLDLKPETARAIQLLKLGTAMPAPPDADKLAELTRVATRMEATYGSGKYCPAGPESCKSLGELSSILAHPRQHSYEELQEAWTGWRTITTRVNPDSGTTMREDYARFVELTNEGARALGYENLGVMWRSGYDMAPDAFRAELDRLWSQVEPLYEGLHCYVRAELEQHYGDKLPDNGRIPAHLLGNMWAQQWGNIFPLVEPYPDASELDVGTTLRAWRDKHEQALLATLEPEAGIPERAEKLRQAEAWIAREMTESAEAFYTSMGIRELPDSFWQQSLFIKPRDRDVVCHASAWDIDMQGDVRIKMCITPTEEDLATIYHELGHLYYDLAYNPLPPIFQAGAHDGFHEAIGDTIVLAMTPDYLAEAGLIEQASDSREAVINRQLKMALDKVAFLPFGRMIDEWRWRVFSGEITPENYNAGWWELRRRYQGIEPPVPRSEAHFDPGAKYHIPANTPYTRYFLAHILQFQFYKAMCDAAGHEGPLYQCSFFGSEKAGERFWAMMEKGASQPWPQTLELLTGTREMDAAALIEYFQPLQEYLDEQNRGRQCGWES